MYNLITFKIYKFQLFLPLILERSIRISSWISAEKPKDKYRNKKGNNNINKNF